MHDGEQVVKVVAIRHHEDLGNSVLVRHYMTVKEIAKVFDDESLAKNDPWTNKPIMPIHMSTQISRTLYTKTLSNQGSRK